MNKKFIFLALAATVGILVGGVGGSYLRGQDVSWMFVSLNVMLVVGILYVILNKKNTDVEEEKLSWAERSERRKKKKRK